KAGDATVYSLIGDGSPMEQHMTGRLTATSVPAGGITQLAAPRAGEDLFLYVTDGSGQAVSSYGAPALGQYDVMLTTPQVEPVTLSAGTERLDFLSFYLPSFLAQSV